jgi:hypothetical protein
MFPNAFLSNARTNSETYDVDEIEGLTKEVASSVGVV